MSRRTHTEDFDASEEDSERATLLMQRNQQQQVDKWRYRSQHFIFVSLLAAAIAAFIGMNVVAVGMLLYVRYEQRQQPHDHQSLGRDSNLNFGVIIDAGSTGSRIHIFNWTTPDAVLPTGWNKKITPDLSCFADNPSEAGESLRPLMDYAMEKLNVTSTHDDKEKRPLLFLKATAGLRLLPHNVTEAILDSVRAVLHSYDDYFHFRDQDAQVIPGTQEAAFAWAALNQMANNFAGAPDNISAGDFLGIVELGGASTQIAFMPLPDEPIPDEVATSPDYFFEFDIYFVKKEITTTTTTTTISSSDQSSLQQTKAVRRTYRPYVHIFLAYGMYTALAATKQLVYELWHNAATTTNVATTTTIPNPCLFLGYNESYAPITINDHRDQGQQNHNNNITFVGEGSISECLSVVEKLLDPHWYNDTSTDSNNNNKERRRRRRVMMPSSTRPLRPTTITTTTTTSAATSYYPHTEYCPVLNCSFAGAYQPRLPPASMTRFFTMDALIKIGKALQKVLDDDSGSGSGSDNDNDSDSDFPNLSSHHSHSHPTSSLSSYDVHIHSLDRFESATALLCSLGWGEVQRRLGNWDDELPNFPIQYACFDAVYALVLLRDGFGFDPRGEQFRLQDELNGYDVSWTLGAMLYEVNRAYSSSSNNKI